MNNKWLPLQALTASLMMAGYVQNLRGQGPEFNWAENGGNSSFSEGNVAIAAAEPGGFYLAGEFTGTAQFGTLAVTSSGGYDFFLAHFHENGTPDWILRFGGTDNDYISSMELTPAGNVILGGYFYGTTQIGNETFTSAGSQDLFLASLSADGAFQWAEHISSVQTDYLNALTVDPSGNILTAGKFYEDIHIGDTALISQGSADFFIAKFTPEGALLWIEQGGGDFSDNAVSIAADANSNLFVSGSFYSEIRLGDSIYTTTNPTGVFLARYTGESDLVWAYILDGTDLNASSSVQTDNDGNVFIAGYFSDLLHLGSQTFQAGEFDTDVYIAKFTGAGSPDWAGHGGSDASDDVISMDVDEHGNAYLTGHYLLDITFGNIGLDYTLCCGSAEIYVVKYDNKGIPVWGTQISGERAKINRIDVTDGGNGLFAGIFQNEVNMGDITLQATADFNNFFGKMSWENLTDIHIREDLTTQIYPNPAGDRIFIRKDINTGMKVSIFDLNGRNVKTDYLDAGTMSNAIDISDLAGGVYTLVISRENGEVISFDKVLVNN